jgi:hypothetical protein
MDPWKNTGIKADRAADSDFLNVSTSQTGFKMCMEESESYG